MKPMANVTGTLMKPHNVARNVALGTLVAGILLALAGCIGGWSDDNVGEGNRCNPYLSHNECASGLACTVSSWQVSNAGTLAYNGLFVPALGSGAGPVQMYCPENYCCPVDSNGNLMASSDPNCQAGCNGGAQSICTATGDPAACAFADGGQAAVNALEAGAPAMMEAGTPAEAGAGD
jgi:hypothetical protein